MHNGWINYETWLYMLHRGENAYEQLQEWISEDYEMIFADLDIKESIEEAIAIYASSLKEYAMEEFFHVLQNTHDAYISDALAAMLKEIDFNNIVRVLTPDIIDQIKKEAA